MIGLYIVGDDDTTPNVTVDTLDQNNSTYNFTTYGQPFGKTCYDSIYFMCIVLCTSH